MTDTIFELLTAIGIVALAIMDAPVQMVIVCSALYLGVVIHDSLKGGNANGRP